MGKTNGQAVSDEISCDILGCALIIKQKSALCGPFFKDIRNLSVLDRTEGQMKP